jgi:hypothetical protein
LDLYELRTITPGAFDQAHLLEQEITVLNQPLHLPFLSVELLSLGPASLPERPRPLALDLVSFRRIWCVACASDASELRRADITYDACLCWAGEMGGLAIMAGPLAAGWEERARCLALLWQLWAKGSSA